MVRGTTRQVLVVKGHDAKLFEQAIFLVRDDALADGGVSEDALLQEARQVCSQKYMAFPIWHKTLWALSGAATTGLLWLLSILF